MRSIAAFVIEYILDGHFVDSGLREGVKVSFEHSCRKSNAATLDVKVDCQLCPESVDVAVVFAFVREERVPQRCDKAEPIFAGSIWFVGDLGWNSRLV